MRFLLAGFFLPLAFWERAGVGLGCEPPVDYFLSLNAIRARD